jgi:hypothetical protein
VLVGATVTGSYYSRLAQKISSLQILYFVSLPATEPHRSKHWHPIDYVIVRKKRQDVRVTKTMYGAEFWTNHRHIMSKSSTCELNQPGVHMETNGSITKRLKSRFNSPCPATSRLNIKAGKQATKEILHKNLLSTNLTSVKFF